MNRNDLPAPNMTCEVCGRKYRRCKRCAELRSKGIEAWREHCDSIECYQTLLLAQTKDLSTITKEQYEMVVSFELPDGNKPVEQIQNRLDEIKQYLYPQEPMNKSSQEVEQKIDTENNDDKKPVNKPSGQNGQNKSQQKYGSWKSNKHKW